MMSNIFKGLTVAASLAMAGMFATVAVADPYFFDDFESGGKSQENGFNWSISQRVSSQHAYSGQSSLQFSFGPNARGADASAEERFSLAPDGASAPTEVWFEYMLRVPDNFTHRDDRPNNNKLFAIFAENYSNVGDVQAVFEYARANSTESYLRVVCMSGRGCLEGDYRTHVLDTSMRGQWVRIRIHVRAGADDGLVTLWRDQTRVYSIANYRHYFSGGNNYWRNGYIMGWANSGFSEETNFYIDDFKVYDEDPGWQVRPGPPVDLRVE